MLQALLPLDTSHFTPSKLLVKNVVILSSYGVIENKDWLIDWWFDRSIDLGSINFANSILNFGHDTSDFCCVYKCSWFSFLNIYSLLVWHSCVMISALDLNSIRRSGGGGGVVVQVISSDTGEPRSCLFNPSDWTQTLQYTNRQINEGHIRR